MASGNSSTSGTIRPTDSEGRMVAVCYPAYGSGCWVCGWPVDWYRQQGEWCWAEHMYRVGNDYGMRRCRVQ